jgi:hypothetical protein
MNKLFLAIALPLWWIIVVTPDLRLILERTDPVENVIALGLVLIAARVSELLRTGEFPRLPSLRRENGQVEYAVEFADEGSVWNEED